MGKCQHADASPGNCDEDTHRAGLRCYFQWQFGYGDAFIKTELHERDDDGTYSCVPKKFFVGHYCQNHIHGRVLSPKQNAAWKKFRAEQNAAWKKARAAYDAEHQSDSPDGKAV